MWFGLIFRFDLSLRVTLNAWLESGEGQFVGVVMLDSFGVLGSYWVGKVAWVIRWGIFWGNGFLLTVSTFCFCFYYISG